MLTAISNKKLTLLLSYLFVILLPFVFLLKNINKFAVDVPFFDEWTFMGQVLDRLQDSSLSWAEIVAPHNEHRIASTVLTYAVTLSLNSWNRITASYLNVLTALAGFLVFYSAITPVLRNQRQRFLLISTFITSFLFFSPQAFENWTWGFQIQWFQLNLLILITLLLVCAGSLNLRKVLLSAAVGGLSALTTASGLLIWPAGIIAILARRASTKDKIIYCLIWSILGAIIWHLYHLGLPSKSLLAGVNGNAIEIGKTLLTLLGAPIANVSVDRAIYWGIIGGALSVIFFPIFIFKSFTIADVSIARFFRFQASILVFAGLNAAAISLARFSLGGTQYVLDASRYTTIISLFWVSLLSGIAIIASQEKKIFAKLIFIIFTGVIGFQFKESINQSESLWAYRQFILNDFKNALLSSSSDLLNKDSKRVAAISRVGLFSLETCKKLQDHKLSLFSPLAIQFLNSSPGNSKITAGFIDQLESKYDETDGIWKNVISGWAISPNNLSEAAARVVIFYNGKALASPKPVSLRVDVVSVMKLRPNVLTGWSYEFTSDHKVVRSEVQAVALDKEAASASYEQIKFSS